MTKILLVEDDKSLREIYGVRLLAEGYDIVSAGDGEEALAMAIKERPALIVSDVMMPKISGFDMLDILRSTTETRDVKVIMMTALSSEDQRQRGEALGADRYLVKSQVGIEDVVRTVHEVLGDAPEPAPVAPAPTTEPVATDAPAPAAPQGAPAATLPSSAELAADAQAQPFPEQIPTVPAEQHEVLESDSLAGPVAAQVTTPVPTTQDNTATAPTAENSFTLPTAAPMPSTPTAPDNPVPTAPETVPEQPVTPDPTPTDQTPPADALPQPTAPFSSPSPRPTNLGERVIQPLSQEPQPDMSKMMEQELSDQLASMQSSQPAQSSDDFTLPTPEAAPTPHDDLTLDALEPLPTPTPTDDKPLNAAAAMDAELATADPTPPSAENAPFVLPTPTPMPTDQAPTATPEPTTDAPQPTNAFPPQPPAAA